ncbi:MAG: hypothetical protein JW995_05350 [Melioribacteraceae bacterium]|nr:hypothetical protein [Melioribacteraceae bacterium]
MRRLETNIILILLIASQTYAQVNSDPFAETFTKYDLQEKSIITLNDIFSLSHKWKSSTINGYSNRASGNGLSTYQRQNFIVLVNGQKFDISFMDDINLDNLPFTIEQVDSVVFINSPINYKGYFTQSGLIEFILQKPAEGFSLTAMQSIGNMAGDPGPFAYTQYRSSNIDKLGFVAGIGLTSKGDNWQLTTSVKYNENFITDKSLSNRISMLTESSKQKLIGTSAEIGYNFLNGYHNFIFAFNQNDDFIFFPIYGNEIPSKRILRHTGFAGNFPIGKSITINYKITKSINELARSDNSLNLNFDLKLNTTVIGSGINYNNSYFNSGFNLVYEKYDGNRSGLNNDEQFNFLKLYWTFSFNPLDKIDQSFNAGLVKNSKKNIYKASWLTSYVPANGHSLTLNASYFESTLTEDLNYFTWTANGLPLILPEVVEKELIGNQSGKSFGLDFIYDGKFKLINTSIGGFVRRFEKYYLDNYYYHLSSKTKYLTGELQYSTMENITQIGLNAGLEFFLTKQLTGDFSYTFMKGIEGSEQFLLEWRKFPIHSFRCDLNYSNDGFAVWWRIQYSSSSYWEDYKYLTAQTFSFYNHDLKGKILIDLSFQKYFWNNKIWINLLFKNLLNQEERYSPIGIKYGLRFYLITHLRFESLLN